MTREKYESLSLAVLKDLAKRRGLHGISTMRKSQVIDAMCALDEKESAAGADAAQETGAQPDTDAAQRTGVQPDTDAARKTGAQPDADAARRTGTKSDTDAAQEPAARPASPAKEVREPARSYSGTGTRRSFTPGRNFQRDSRDQRYSRDTRAARDYRDNRDSRAVQDFRDNRDARDAGDYRDSRDVRAVRDPREAGDRSFQAQTEMQAQMPAQAQVPVKGPAQNSMQPQVQETEDLVQRIDERDRPPMDIAQLDSGNVVSGILEVMQDGYGFIRSNNYLPGDNDVYVSPSQIRRFNLKTGDIVTGNTRIHSAQEKFSALLYVRAINGLSPSESAKRMNFEDMTPIFPNERLRMERGGKDVAMRIVDLIAPIGKGQRGMIVSPPKAGKTTLLKEIAKSILQNNPEMHILIMLIDERPEEVTDIREEVVGDNVEVVYSTFDETPEHHKRVAEMGIERAKRLVEQHDDVVILLDSITRLARAYNLIVPPSGRTLSGGLDPAALHPPKRFFGAARNMREGGSLTILATALIDTGSKMDDVVYEEFKGTGNMELVLDRKLSERRVFPAINIQASGTRREDLLLNTDEQEAVLIMRRALNGMKSEEAVETILNMFAHTRGNEELIRQVRRMRVI